MKKFLLSLLCLLMLSTPVLAQKSEWVDPAYDFTKAKTICIDYAAAPEIVDGSRDKESRDVFFEQAKADIVKKLAKGKYNVELTNTPKDNKAGKEATSANHSASNAQVVSGEYDLLISVRFHNMRPGKNMWKPIRKPSWFRLPQLF